MRRALHGDVDPSLAVRAALVFAAMLLPRRVRRPGLAGFALVALAGFAAGSVGSERARLCARPHDPDRQSKRPREFYPGGR
jgi:hypothetical protein